MPTISGGSGRGLPLALTGAVTGTRYVGGNASGAPGSGTFSVGDFVVNADGSIFVCTVAGTPGTWVDTATIGPSVASVFGRTGTVVAASNDYTDAQVQNSPTNVLTATGDLLYASGANTLARRAIGSASQVLTVSGGVPVWSAAAGGSSAWFGDGSDGAGVADGSTALAGATRSGSTYTLTRDVFYSSLTISSGVTIVTNGFRLFCSGTITGADGTSLIQWNGAAGLASGTAPAATNNTNSSINLGTGATSSPGTAGGAGNTGAGSAGSNASSAVTMGAAGGVGGTGTGGAGGNGGTVAAMTAVNSPPRSAIPLIWGNTMSGNGLGTVQGGSGGGGGGGDGTNKGGSGGSGGGLVVVVAKTFAGTGAIQARGGAGGTPTAGNTGGGGGGGGGYVGVLSSSVSAGAISGWTIDANGGAKGSPHGSGTDNAAAGSNGSAVLLPS